jgi:hypothetical protein
VTSRRPRTDGHGHRVGPDERVRRPQKLVAGRDAEETPQIAFEYEYDADTGMITVVHTGGDVVSEDNATSLAVRVDGGRARTFDLPVSAGDRVTVEGLVGDETIRTVWTVPDGNRTTVLGTFEVPG